MILAVTFFTGLELCCFDGLPLSSARWDGVCYAGELPRIRKVALIEGNGSSKRREDGSEFICIQRTTGAICRLVYMVGHV